MNWIKLFGEVNSIKVKSITDPLFRFSLLFGVLGGAVACFTSPVFVWAFLLSCCGLCLLLGIGFYIYFAIKCPDYLRSESFHLSKHSIDILGDDKNRLNPNMDKIIPIANPFAKEAGAAQLGPKPDQEA